MALSTFYPYHHVLACQTAILKKLRDLLENRLVINVWGPPLCGKSCTLGRFAQDLQKEGRHIAWLNCRSSEPDLDLVGLVLQALSQYPEQSVVFGERRNVSPTWLRLQPREILWDTVLAASEKHSVVFCFDDFHHVAEGSSLMEFLKYAIPKAKNVRFIMITREQRSCIPPSSEEVFIAYACPERADGWAMSDSDMEGFGMDQPEARTWLGEQPLHPHSVILLKAVLSAPDPKPPDLQSNTRASTFHLIRFLFSSLPDDFRRVLTGASLVRGPRPIPLLEHLGEDLGLTTQRQQAAIEILSTNGFIALQKAESGHDPMFALSEELALAVQRFNPDVKQAADLHCRIAQYYRRRVEHGSPTLREIIPDLDEAIYHYCLSDRHGTARELLEKQKVNLLNARELPKLQSWYHSLLDWHKRKDPENAVDILFDLCDISRMLTNSPRIRIYVSEARALLKTSTHTMKQARADYHEAMAEVIETDFSSAKRLLESSLYIMQGQQADSDTIAQEQSILLWLARLGIFQVDMRYAIGKLKQLLTLKGTDGARGCSPKIDNFLLSLLSEISLTMGFPDRSVAYARKAAEVAAGLDDFRIAVSAYWLTRALVFCAEVDDSGREDYLAQARRHADEMLQKYWDAGSVDVWWGMEFYKVKAMVELASNELSSFNESIMETERISPHDCERNKIHIGLLRAESLMPRDNEELGPSDREQRMRRTEQAALDVLGMIDSLGDRSNLRSARARVHEILGRIGSNKCDLSPYGHLVIAAQSYLIGRQFYHAGRCFQRMAALQDGASGLVPADVPFIKAWSHILDKTHFREPNYAPAEQYLEFLTDMEDRTILPVATPYLKWGLQGALPHVADEVSAIALKAAEQTVRLAEHRPDKLNQDQKELLGWAEKMFSLTMNSLRLSQSRVSDMLQQCTQLHTARYKCTMIRCDVFQGQSKTPLASGYTVDFSRSGALISISEPTPRDPDPLSQGSSCMLAFAFPDGYETQVPAVIKRRFRFVPLLPYIHFATGVSVNFDHPLGDQEIKCFNYPPCLLPAVCPVTRSGEASE